LLLDNITPFFCHIIVANGTEFTWQLNRITERLASELTVTLDGDTSKSWITEINMKTNINHLNMMLNNYISTMVSRLS